MRATQDAAALPPQHPVDEANVFLHPLGGNGANSVFTSPPLVPGDSSSFVGLSGVRTTIGIVDVVVVVESETNEAEFLLSLIVVCCCLLLLLLAAELALDTSECLLPCRENLRPAAFGPPPWCPYWRWWWPPLPPSRSEVRASTQRLRSGPC